MNGQWRLFREALRFCIRPVSKAADTTGGIQQLGAAARYVPIAAASVGAVGAGIYGFGALLWPTSVAVVLSMLATILLDGGLRDTTPHADQLRGFGTIPSVMLLLLKYSALMALSAANLPFAVPANAALGLIMICGHAAAGSMAVSLMPSAANATSTSTVSNMDLSVALAVGLAPAALLGIPGLIGLVVAFFARAAFGAYLKRNRATITCSEFHDTRRLTEVSFYLGAIASWSLV